MYKVIYPFMDLQDSKHSYRVGDTFPRGGVTVSEQRIQELCGSRNKQQKPLIEFVGESADLQKADTQYTKTDINRMSKDELVTLATEIGIPGAGEMTGVDIKKALIEKFGL